MLADWHRTVLTDESRFSLGTYYFNIMSREVRFLKTFDLQTHTVIIPSLMMWCALYFDSRSPLIIVIKFFQFINLLITSYGHLYTPVLDCISRLCQTAYSFPLSEVSLSCYCYSWAIQFTRYFVIEHAWDMLCIVPIRV